MVFEWGYEKLKILLVSCDIFWSLPELVEFDDIIICRDFTNLTKERLETVTHWIVDPAPQKKIDDGVISQFKNLQVIGSPSTGTTHIDITNKSINVFCLRDIKKEKLNLITASSEYTFLLFLSLVKNFQSILNADISKWRDNLRGFRGRQINQMQVAIFGVGRIGSNLTRYLQSFGAKVFYFDPEKNLGGDAIKLSLSEMKAKLPETNATFVCFHASESNHEFFNAELLSLLHKQSYFINTSRGENIDEVALCELVQSGHFAGVGLDVLTDEQAGKFENRPIVRAAKGHQNMIITPHVAGVSSDSERLAFEFIYELVVI